MKKNSYIFGVVLQIVFTLVYILCLAGLISDLSYLSDNQAIPGAENELYTWFGEQLIFGTVVYIILMLVAQVFKFRYKRLKKKKRRVQGKQHV
ncbi:hypothetical protein [Bacillus dicomae]|uniref:Uncharacterized protein n=1 Tax=Bacillus dicomae TaxID=3088378 RepID=A0AC61SZI6_9BACI|nr:hypothetical protein [Bacillus dicomae]TPV39548.1 hypothetical protein FJ659_24530 [Bacillus dicomae]